MRLRSADEIVSEALRGEIGMLLGGCTKAQQGVFDAVWPKGLQKMSEEELRNALALCQRTVRKNMKLSEDGTILGPVT